MTDVPDMPADEIQPNADPAAQQLADLQKKADEYLAGWQRAKADYLNHKRESEKQWSEMVQFSNAAIVAELLPILRNFKLAMQHVPADVQTQGWMQGFDHIRRQFEEFLKKFGIEEIKTVGETFNPEFHEAVSREKKDGVATDVIIEELQAGYALHGKVIEPARVKVAE
jgi:molecular chaperone GrpE